MFIFSEDTVSNKILDLDSACSELTAIDFEDLGFLDCCAEELKVAELAVKWIASKKMNYEAFGLKSEVALQKVVECASSVPEYGKFKAAVKNYFSVFVNNPYICENGLIESGKDYAVAENILCYFVEYRGMPVPMGMLYEFFDEAQMDRIIKQFLKSKTESYERTLKQINDKCSAVSDHLRTDKTLKKRLYRNTVFCAVILLTALMFVFKKLVFGVDFELISKAIGSGASIFQKIGYITQESYGINLNNTFGTIIFCTAVFWAIVALSLIKPFVEEIKNCKIYRKRDTVTNSADKLMSIVGNLASKCADERNFVINKSDNFGTLKVTRNNNVNIGSYIEDVNSNGDIDYYPAIVRNLKNTGLLIILLILSLFTLYLNANAKAPEFSEKYNTFVQQFFAEKFAEHVYAHKGYCVASEQDVFSSADENSIVIYKLKPAEVIECLPDDNPESEYFKVKFNTEYGVLNGYMKKTATVEYTPSLVPETGKFYPSDLSASSEGKGSLNNINDDKSNTSWGESADGIGVGEYVQLEYNEKLSANSFMIQTGYGGNWAVFKKHLTPIKYSVEFYSDDEVVCTVPVTVNEDKKKQYFCLSRPVTFDRVKFVIEDIAEEKLDGTSYITELSVYGTERK